MKSSLLLAFAVVGAVTLNSPFVVLPAQAQEMSEVPIELFCIGLGSIYEYPSDGAGENAVGTFPVKRLVSEQRSLHRRRSLYFEPLIENQVFPFREIEQGNEACPITTYRLYVFPIIPTDVATLAELQERNLPQMVTIIEWSRGNSELEEGDGYTWALDLCRSMEADLGIDPVVTDIVERDTYSASVTLRSVRRIPPPFQPFEPSNSGINISLHPIRAGSLTALGSQSPHDARRTYFADGIRR